MRGPPPRPRPRRLRLAVGRDDLVDVQEAVLLEADVDERGLHAGEHVVDAALVDVADDRAAAAALDVELGDAPVLVDLRHALRPLLLLLVLPGAAFLLSSIATRVSPRSTDTNTCLRIKSPLGTEGGLRALLMSRESA